MYKEIQDTDKKTGTNRAQALVEAIAGKNRSNIASSILFHPELLEQVYASAQDANNSAMDELSKYLDSIDGRIQQLTNRIQEFWSVAINSEAIKTGISLITDLVSGVTTLVDRFGTIPSIAGAIGAALSINNVGRGKMFPFMNMPTA